MGVKFVGLCTIKSKSCSHDPYLRAASSLFTPARRFCGDEVVEVEWWSNIVCGEEDLTAFGIRNSLMGFTFS